MRKMDAMIAGRHPQALLVYTSIGQAPPG